MSRIVWVVCTIALMTCASAAGSSGDDAGTARARGRYLVGAMDCGACHTPWRPGPNGPEPDAARMMSGHPQDAALPAPPQLAPGPWNVVTAGNTAWAGPWGVSYSSNLTPDEETGIGSWTEEAFAGAMRDGKHLGTGRDVLPPMPRYPGLTDEDLKAIFVYLRSLPPISNRVPEPDPPPAAP